MSKKMIIMFNLLMALSFCSSLYFGLDVNSAVIRSLITLVSFNGYAYFLTKKRKKVQ